jgi:uncharacterized protein YkwD
MRIFGFLSISTLLCSVAVAQDAAQVLAEINLARTQPQMYARIVAETARPGREGEKAIREAVRFLEKARPLPALSLSAGLSRAAMDHALDSGSRGTMGHGGSDGSRPWDRVERYGQWVGLVGENISYGYSDPRQIVVTLLVDDGVRGRKHRANLFHKGFRVAGVACSRHGSARTICVTDFAGGFIESGGSKVARL